MRLFIAEKPDIAKALCAALGGGFSSKDGYYEKGDDVITWCFGHMMQLLDPEEHDPAYKKWSLEQLPFYFEPKLKPGGDGRKKAQFKCITNLIEQADTIVNAGDPDEEGQLLVDEILRYVKNTKPVMRVLINDNNTKVVAKAIANMQPNSMYEHLGYKAEARSIADQTFGYNFSRLFTVLSQMAGGQGTLSVGRVQTPILHLVVKRDRANAAHQKTYYYNVDADFSFPGHEPFKARYQVKEGDAINDSGKLIDKNFAENLAKFCLSKQAVISSVDTKEKKKSPPLPYNLLKLQQDAARKWGYGLDETLQITQSLREKHKLITYNRSDCQYLSDEQFEDVPNVLAAIAQTAGILAGAAGNADSSKKGKVFNSNKVTAHHAIIPTETIGDLTKLSEKEKNIYMLIARAYIAQFYPDYTFLETSIAIDVLDDNNNQCGCVFGVKSNVDLDLGWKRLYKNDVGNEETEKDSDIQDLDLRSLQPNSLGQCLSAVANELETKPPALFTMASLLGALTRVSGEVKDPKLAAILKEKDKDKEGEHGGIGTPATRSSIIETLFERGFLVEKNKNVISTDLGKSFYDQLPDIIKYPDMTAIWHEQQKDIQSLDDVKRFIKNMLDSMIYPEVNRLKSMSFKAVTHNCPKCGRYMIRRNGNDGFWWGCSGYNDEQNPCKYSMDDVGGKPVERKSKASSGKSKAKGMGFGFKKF